MNHNQQDFTRGYNTGFRAGYSHGQLDILKKISPILEMFNQPDFDLAKVQELIKELKK